MSADKPTDPQHIDPLPGDAEMARLYRAAAKDMPPVTLDAQILAEARYAVSKPKPRGPFGGHWTFPLSTAAVIVLSVGIVLLFSQQGVLNQRDAAAPLLSEAPPPSPASSAPVTSGPALPVAKAPAKAKAMAKPAPPEPTRRMAASPAASSVAAEAKKAERTTAAPAAEAMPRARMAEERDHALRDDVRTQDTLAKETFGMGVTADVMAVQTTGQPGAYQFSVGIRSPDKGCAQYADWWEVVSKDGKLLYRRVLLHSHVDEQPFTRSGGPVPIQPDTVVWVRAHMNTVGYGGIAFIGSPKTGFIQAIPDAKFAADLAQLAPLPEGCDF